MKSSNPSIRRIAFAATVFAIGSLPVFAQSSATSAQGSSSMSNNNSSTQNSRDPSADNSNYSSTTSASSPSSNSSYQSSDMSNTSSSKKLSWGDRHFITKAADGGQDEVALGQLAAEKASNPDVRQFGQTLVQDHTNANSQLMQIAQQKNVKIDQEDVKDRTYKRLSKASGTDFDRAFVDHEVEDHEKDIKMFEKAANNSKDPDVRQFASSTLPKLKEHLAMAQRLQRSIVPTGHDSDSWNASNNSSDMHQQSSTTGATSRDASMGANGSSDDKATSNASSTSGTTSNPDKTH